MAYCFTCVIKGDLGSLVERWEGDREKGRNERREGKGEGGGGDLCRQWGMRHEDLVEL